VEVGFEPTIQLFEQLRSLKMSKNDYFSLTKNCQNYEELIKPANQLFKQLRMVESTPKKAIGATLSRSPASLRLEWKQPWDQTNAGSVSMALRTSWFGQMGQAKGPGIVQTIHLFVLTFSCFYSG
jgi:hypothetical protein